MQDLSKVPLGKPSFWGIKSHIEWLPDDKWVSQKQLSQSSSYATTNVRTDTGSQQKSKEDRSQCQTQYEKLQKTGCDEGRCPCGEHWRCTIQ